MRLEGVTQRQFEQLLDQAADVILVGDERGVCEWASSAAETILGWRPELLVGRTADELVHLDDQAAVVATGWLHRDGPTALDAFRVLGGDGRYHWVSGRAITLPAGDGRSRRVVVLREVEELPDVRIGPLADAAIAESEARYRRLAEHASDIVFEAMPDGTITWMSPSVERTLGWTPTELLGRRLTELMPHDDAERAVNLRADVFRGAAVDGAELRVRDRDGELHWMSVRAAGVDADDGTINAAVVTLVHACEIVVERRAAATLAEVSAVLVRADAEEELLRDVCEAAVEEGGYALAWYGRGRDDDRHSVEVVAHSARNADYVEEIQVSWDASPLGSGPAGRALRTGRTQVVADVETAPDYGPWRDAARRRGLRSTTAVPVPAVDGHGAIDGVLLVYAPEPGAFGPRAVELLEHLAAALAYGLARLRDRDRLDQALHSAVDLLAATVESRDPYTAGHQGHVALLAVAIGEVLGFDPDHLRGLQYAANVHDVGKIAVPSAILNKPGHLDDAEMEVVRRHAAVGADIARRFGWPWPIADVIEQHHERWDGGGYPLGFRGEEILLDARIIAVADAFQAIAADRPYRAARGFAAAREIIESESGSHFDPRVVAAFCLVLDRGFAFPRALDP